MPNLAKLFGLFFILSFLLPQSSIATENIPFSRQISNAAPDNVQYFGGPLLTNVNVQLVFWGEGVEANLQDTLEKFYRGIVNSNYMDQLAEYSSPTQTIGRGSFGNRYTITPFNKSKSLTQADIEVELDAQIAAGALPKPDANTLFMFHYPNGYSIQISFGDSCSSWFADHEVYVSKKFGNIFYAMFPCDSANSDSLSSLTEGASHELAEAVTDPLSPLQGVSPAYPAGWLTPNDEQEIGDLCGWQEDTLSIGKTKFTVQAEWLNSKRKCSKGPFKSDN